MQKFIISEEDKDVRLDRWFKRHHPHITQALLQKMLRKKDVRVNGLRAEASLRVKAGDVVTITIDIKPPTEMFHVKHSSEMQVSDRDIADFNKLIIFENNDFLVINKPHGLASQGGRGVKISVDDIIKKISPRYKLVHRLDKDTCGVLVIAKKTSMATAFSEALQSKQVEKIYWALLRGVPQHKIGEIDLPLLKSGRNIEKVEVNMQQGKPAITQYRVLEKLGKELSWVELRPITGRTHQLRVHMEAIGCPIIGDGKYGGKRAFEEGFSKKLHLIARRIIIPQFNIDASADLPDYMKETAPKPA